MRLLIHERLNLMGLLPQEGDFTTLRIVREMREALSFTEKEHEALNFKQVEEEGKPAQITWTNPEDSEILNKDVPIGKKGQKIIEDALEKLDKDKKLTEQHFSLYEKFCMDGKEGDS